VSTFLQSVTAVLVMQRLGPAALLAGTAAGLLLRIAAAFRFAAGSVRESGDTAAFVSSLLPNWRCGVATCAFYALVLNACRRRRVCAVLVACGAVAAASNSKLQAAPFSQRAVLIHLTVGLGAAVVAGLAALRWEQDTLTALRVALRPDSKRE
jgi:hypothetical protein